MIQVDFLFKKRYYYVTTDKLTSWLCNVLQFLSMRIASLSPVLYGFGMDSDAFSDHTQVCKILQSFR